MAEKPQGNIGGFWSALMTTSWLRWWRSHGAHAALAAAQTYKRNGQDSDVQALGEHEMEMFRILRGGNKTKNWILASDCKRADWSWPLQNANSIHSPMQLRGRLERGPWWIFLERKEVPCIWLIFKHILLWPQAKSNSARNKSCQGGRRPV